MKERAVKTDRKRGGGVSLYALALRCSPAVIKANPGIFPEAADKVGYAAFTDPKLGEPWPDADGLVLRLAGYAPKSVNATKGRGWWATSKAKKEARIALARALVDIGMMHPPQAGVGSRWQLHFIRHGHGLLDRDNLTAAFKQLQDAIVNTGLILDDNAKVLWPTHDQRIVKRSAPVATTVYFRRVMAGEELRPWFPDIE